MCVCARVHRHETFLHISKRGIPVMLRLFANILITFPSTPSGYGGKNALSEELCRRLCIMVIAFLLRHLVL